ncbi:stage III sporulation protein AE [bacterium]|nr:stage III sporulation protein AE [bacterium]
MKCSKVLILIIILLIAITEKIEAIENETLITEQEDSLGIHSLIEDSREYTNNFFENSELEDILELAIHGKIDNTKLMKNTFKIFGTELKSTITLMGSIVLIIIVNAILTSITDELENKSVSKIAYYVQFILIVTIILGNYSEIINMVKEAIDNMVGFTNLLIPILITLIITTGNITTATVMQPVIVFMISLIGNFIKNVAIPILLVSTVLGIISQISSKVKVDRLAKRLKSSTIWIIGIILTVFVTIVSMDKTLSTGVDAVTSKTAKAAVSSLVPVVGKILGDAVDSVIGCSNILKNALGIVGVIIIIAISILPIIKLLLLMAVYHITAAICEPIADEKIIKLLDSLGDTFKVLLAFLCSVSVMIIIGTTLIIKISSSA